MNGVSELTKTESLITGAAEDFARWIDDPELAVADLAPLPETGAATPLGNLMSLAGVVGALAGA